MVLDRTGHPSCSRNIAVLLTATVRVNSPRTTITDESRRMREYAQSCAHWQLQCPETPVILVENSCANVDILDITARENGFKLFRTASFRGTVPTEKGGKGAAEMEIIDWALSNVKSLKEADIILKVTGRTILRNARALIRSLRSKNFDVCADFGGGLTYANSRVFAATPSFLRDRLLPLQDIIDEPRGTYFEHVLAMACHASMSMGSEWIPMPVRPRFSGFSGSAGNRLDEHAWTRVVNDVKHWVRCAAYGRR